MRKIQTIFDLADEEIREKRVIIRVDFNVPMVDGRVSDDTRILSTLPTINYLLKRSPRSLVIISHLGRPKGKIVKKLSIEPVAKHLEKIIKKEVTLVPNLDDLSFLKCKSGSIFILENIRFWQEEEAKKITKEVIAFRKRLSSLGDVYINDAFACCHRPHSSIVGIDVVRKVAGILIKKEIDAFSDLLKPADEIRSPFLAIIGGAKCPALAFTFLKVEGIEIGNSIYKKEWEKDVNKVNKKITEMKHEGKEFEVVLPIDHVECPSPSKESIKTDGFIKALERQKHNAQIKSNDEGISSEYAGYDIGPKTMKLFSEVIGKAKTILWNGPAGVTEIDDFAKGSYSICKAMSDATKKGALTYLAGGDSCSMAKKFCEKNEGKFFHISTGGGASFELVRDGTLPGFEILD